MKLNIDRLREITTGATSIAFRDGMYHFSRFNDQEVNVTDNPNVRSCAGIQMVFKTDARLLRLHIYTQPINDIRSYFAFDVVVNNNGGELVSVIYAVKLRATNECDVVADKIVMKSP